MEGTLLLNWIKKKQEAVEEKVVSPNHKLYLWLLLGAIALTGGSLLVQGCQAFFTIWTSITCGGIASILVAWLIDAANCRQVSAKVLKNREALFANFYHVFENGLQLLILECAEIDQCSESKRWYEWVDTAAAQAQQNSEKMIPFIRNLMLFFDDIAEQVFVIKSQEATMLDSGIICQEDIQALSTMQAICESSRTVFRSKDTDSECFQRFITYCSLLRGLIGFAPTLRPINDILVEPRVYLMALENGIIPQPEEKNLENAP